MSETKRTLKQKAVHELREYLVMSFYLFVVFSLFVIYKSVILAEHQIDFALHGFALINALALAKVMLVAQELHLGDQFKDAPLIYPTLLKSFVFTLILRVSKLPKMPRLAWFAASRFTKASLTSAAVPGRESCV